jgi:hypothetical protein
MISFLTDPNNLPFSGYPASFTLDLYVVMSPAGGATPGNGFWVQPFGNGSFQPVRMATWC